MANQNNTNPNQNPGQGGNDPSRRDQGQPDQQGGQRTPRREDDDDQDTGGGRDDQAR